ncbi:flagellar basal body rod protein FlgC [Mesobaculum littorinae]|uniref:Flagellar basal body rod protein FlgC n=1 Tax=Mesobaculum littorinae TaxID=2486419 RepID=A0A438AH91_9RHOB|nr:flagellar basal body rod protein FlgC [Mesobaculum littorinae]RVV97957.1 flagellar basal body rod protein FlgC [Mesobaculum littorinae]
MNDILSSLSTAASGMKAQGARLRYVSENIANADTPGYRRKIAPFEAAVEAGRDTGEVRIGALQLDQTALPKVFDPAHPMADGTGHYEASNVDIMIELADAREAQRSYEANLKMFDQTRQMTQGLLALLKR